jgi:hypothetical protein
LQTSISRFFTADKAVGAKGFKAIWTEIKEGPGVSVIKLFFFVAEDKAK